MLAFWTCKAKSKNKRCPGLWAVCVQVEAAAQAQGGGAGVEDMWADEVTSVLLALVLLSHKQYLQASLLPE